MCKVEGIIFDFDGVLIDTDVCHSEAWKTVINRRDIPFCEDVKEKLRGVSRRESLEILLEAGHANVDDEEKEKMLKEKNEVYLELVSQLDFDNGKNVICSMVDELHKRNIRCGVASSSKNTKAIMELMNLNSCFDGVVDGNDITKSKPCEDVFIRASQEIGIEPQKCLVVEDSEVGIEAAHRAGMRCCFIPHEGVSVDKEVICISKVTDVLEMV